ncbi:MAG: L-threonylcarbamoyladenylate synthase [Cellvibrionales bacterium]|nr:L-threonylcarbamoyladenylate synthase [Cellvibrionales bacterium]
MLELGLLLNRLSSGMNTLSIADTANALASGLVVAYPTEGVWGLGCDPFNELAVRQLLAIKSRPIAKGLILVCSNLAQIKSLVNLSHDELITLDTPLPTTFLVPFHENSLPECVTGEHDRVAIRYSKHPTIKALCDTLGQPIVSTSANPSGKPTATNTQLIAEYFPTIPICEGELGDNTQPSRIIDFQSGKIIR